MTTTAGTAHLPGAHLRLPDERARLRADLRAAGGRRLRAAPRRTTPTWWSSTPARSGRTPTTASTATSATCARPRPGTPACRSRSAAAWRRRTAARSSSKAPWVDVVFGTHNIGSLPALLERARHNAEAEVEILESLEVFPSTLPTRRESTYAGWVSISVGCNNTCTFCIVPCAARQGEGPPARRGPRRGRGAGRRGRARGDAARAERQLVRRRVRRPARVRQAAARLRRDRRAWSGSGSPARTRRTSPTT